MCIKDYTKIMAGKLKHQQPDIYGQVHPIETPALIKSKLAEMEEEIEKLPEERKVSLNLAKEKCPQLLTDSFKLQFLRCEVFRAKVS